MSRTQLYEQIEKMQHNDVAKLCCLMDKREWGKDTEDSIVHLKIQGFDSLVLAVEVFSTLTKAELGKLRPTQLHREQADKVLGGLTDSTTAA